MSQFGNYSLSFETRFSPEVCFDSKLRKEIASAFNNIDQAALSMEAYYIHRVNISFFIILNFE